MNHYNNGDRVYTIGDIDKLEADNAELKVQVEALRKAIIDATNNGAVTDTGKWVYSIDTSVLDKTPAQCLAEVRAQAVEDAAEALYNSGITTEEASIWLGINYANQIRQQADK